MGKSSSGERQYCHNGGSAACQEKNNVTREKTAVYGVETFVN